MPLLELSNYTEAQFARVVSEAFRSYHSLLALARSPLAHTSLVEPALILDELTPTSDERGRALRVVLRWSVTRLCPAPPRYPLGSWRPHTDPAWRDPLWWGYNILRHHYVEPLPPDEREGSLTGTLISLTGIADVDSYYRERNRAISEVARLLREQLHHRQGSDQIRRLALDVLFTALQDYTEAAELAGVAATFRGTYPRVWLIDLARNEGLSDITAELTYLLNQRLLQAGDGDTQLWMPPPLQSYIHAQQPRDRLVRRHRRALHLSAGQAGPLQRAWHLRHAGDDAAALKLLLDNAEELIGELRSTELREALTAFTSNALPSGLRFALQVQLWDLCRRLGDREGALAACRQALKVAASPTQQAQVYRRFGKLYEDYGQRQALDYYRRAIASFDADDAELIDTLKDRAWIHIHRQEWTEAEADLTRALAVARETAWRLRADIHSALASLYRQQNFHERALSHAQKARALREENGAWQLVAESWSNEALVYTRMGEIGAALAAYREALATFERLGNQEAIAIVYLNMGTAHQLAGQFTEAMAQYHHSLTMLEDIGVPLSQCQANYNLAEVYAALGNNALARRYWQQGYDLAHEAGLEGELTWFETLAGEVLGLQTPQPAAAATEAECAAEPPIAAKLSPEERTALETARREGYVTSRRLVQLTGISKSTATRKLAHLLELGLVERRGKGRSVHYVC